MNFSNKLNIIIKSLSLKNSVLSQIADVDPSLISRFRSGIRTPKPNSVQLDKMCIGIIEYANKTHKINTINSICGFPSDMNDQTLLAALKVWLTDTSNLTICNNSLATNNTHPKFLMNFSTKLDDAMTLLDISNISLSKVLSVDPSLISRFRNGSRTPSTKNSSIKNICTYIYNVSLEQNQIHELYELIKLNPSTLNNERESIIEYISDWLCDKKEMAEYTTVSSFLNNLNWITSNEIVFPPVDEIFEKPKEPQKTVFYGYNGLREAFQQLAYNTLNSKEHHDIYFYMDQDLNWVYEEKDFIQHVILTFLKAVNTNCTINLIHSMTHSPSDMFFQIERFLPMHSLGNFHSYYLTGQQVHVFSHIRIVVPGIGCVVGDNLKGLEDTGEFFYYKDTKKIEYYNKQMDALFKQAKPLLITIPKKDGSPAHSLLSDIYALPHARIALQYTLPIDGLDDNLFDELVLCNNIDESIKNDVYNNFNTMRAQKKIMTQSPITEYVPLANISTIPSCETMRTTPIEELLNDPRYVMIPVNLNNMEPQDNFSQLYYSRETYIKHVHSIINVLKENPTYNLVPIEFKPYRNLKLMLVEGHCIISCNNNSKIATYFFNHATLNNLFREYIYSLQYKQYKGSYTKNESIKFLENYIKFW